MKKVYIILYVMVLLFVSSVNSIYIWDSDTGGTTWNGTSAYNGMILKYGNWSHLEGDGDLFNYTYDIDNDYDGDNYYIYTPDKPLAAPSSPRYIYTNTSINSSHLTFWFYDNSSDVAYFNMDLGNQVFQSGLHSSFTTTYTFASGGFKDSGITRTTGWHNFTYILNESTGNNSVSLYIDNTKVYDADASISKGLNSAMLYADTQGSNACLGCRVDNIHFWNRTINFGLDNCTTYTNKALNISFVNTTNRSYINADFEIYVDYTDGSVTKNYSAAYRNRTIALCINPEYVKLNATIHIDYGTSGTNTFTYVSERTLDNLYENITLYISDDTDQVTFTVTDENDDEVEGVFISILEWDVGTNNYNLISSIETDLNGESFGYLNLYDTWYKFIITYGGITYLNTEPTKITSTTKDFQITLGTTPTIPILDLYDLSITLDSDRATPKFDLVWADISEVANGIKLEILRSNTTNGTRNISLQTSTANSGSLTYTIIEATSNVSVSFIANVYVNSSTDNKYYFITSKTLDFKKEWDVFGLKESIMVSFIFIGTIIFVGLAISGEAAIILSIVAMILAYMAGFIMVGTTALASVVVAFIILLAKISRRQ